MITASPELQEREALKGLRLTALMIDALKRRGVPDLTSCVAAELGALAMKIAYERWSDTTNSDEFSELARWGLCEVQASAVIALATLAPLATSFALAFGLPLKPRQETI